MLIRDDIELEYLNVDMENAMRSSNLQDFINDTNDDMDKVLHNVDNDSIHEFYQTIVHLIN